MILQVDAVSKTFSTSSQSEPVKVLQGLNLDVRQGETIAIIGESGSGKSTLLSLLAGLDKPTSGSIQLNGKDISQLSENELAKFRAMSIGIVFQQFHLMSHLTALENVSLPLELVKEKNALERSTEALEKVGLVHRMDHFPHQLSGGECQRVAIARAMVVQPKLLLADEPTGNLDTRTGDNITDLFFDLVKERQMTLILVTHNEKLAARCQKSLQLADGKLNEYTV